MDEHRVDGPQAFAPPVTPANLHSLNRWANRGCAERVLRLVTTVD